jgi:hypothetical protein
MPTEKEIKHSNDEKKDDYISKVKKQKRKWRPLNNNFISITIRFLMLLLLIESFFLYTFLTSKSFLETVSSLTKELRLLISRQPQLEFLLLMEKDLINYNGSHPFLDRDVRQVSIESLTNQNEDYESLLNMFQSNYYSHTSTYNQAFEDIMYSDVCASVNYPGMTQEQCRAVNDGILKKGMYTAVVKYWAILKRILFDFLGSQRSNTDSRTLLNNESLS